MRRASTLSPRLARPSTHGRIPPTDPVNRPGFSIGHPASARTEPVHCATHVRAIIESTWAELAFATRHGGSQSLLMVQDPWTTARRIARPTTGNATMPCGPCARRADHHPRRARHLGELDDPIVPRCPARTTGRHLEGPLYTVSKARAEPATPNRVRAPKTFPTLAPASPVDVFPRAEYGTQQGPRDFTAGVRLEPLPAR